MRRASLIPAVLALLLAACGTDEGDASPNGEPTATSAATMDATESMGDGGEGLTLDDIMNEPELYLNGEVAISADIASAIEGAGNAWILEAGNEDVLLIGPSDGDAEFSEGDAVVLNGMFMSYNPAEIGDLEGVVDEAAIVEAFGGEYVVVAETLEPLDS